MALQSRQFRDGVQVAAIDPSAPYAAGIRRSLPHGRIVLDHFHLVMLANSMPTDVRQRVQREQHARRGRKLDPAWAHRRLLLLAGDKLSPQARARLKTVLASDGRTGELGTARAVKELLRQLLQAHGPTRYSRHETARRLTRLLTACAVADTVETTRTATAIERWWPEIEGSLKLGVTNARTEGHNRVIKQVKRVACGFRNQAHYDGASCCTAQPSGRMNYQQSRSTGRTPLKCEEPVNMRPPSVCTVAPGAMTWPANSMMSRPHGRSATSSRTRPSRPLGAHSTATVLGALSLETPRLPALLPPRKPWPDFRSS